MRFFFEKKHRLLTKKDFQKVFEKKNIVFGKFLKIYYIYTQLSYPRIGIITSSKLGKANLRNIFKRRIRESFRLNKNTYPSIDFIIIPKNKESLIKKELNLDLKCLKQLSGDIEKKI